MRTIIQAPLLLSWLLIPPALADFTDHGDGTVTDSATGLMWDKCPWGQAWSSNTCADMNTATLHNWSAALGVAITANNQSHRGYSDWRLPNKNELESLVERSAYNPAVNTDKFPNTPSGYYSDFWSSTAVPSTDNAWGVYFYDGYVYNYSKTTNSYVRLVRGGQSFDAFPSNIQTYTVTATAGTGGAIRPPTQTVNHGAATTFTVVPDAGYFISSVTGCGGTLSGTSYTTGAITSACTVTASFTTRPPQLETSNLTFSGDYNADGRADMVWQSSNTGDAFGILLNGFQITEQGFFYREPNTAWRIVQNGDFYGSGRGSLLWWNNQTGQVYMMPMRGLSVAGGTHIYQEPNTAWQIVAVGDLNGDRKDDLVWWNSRTGEVYVMLMDGAFISAQGMVYREMDTAWCILAARDFTGDGKADLLWRNVRTGQVYQMPMNGLNIGIGTMIHREPNLDWSIVAIGDLNGDRKADLIWWNSQSGLVWGMLMSGATILSQGAFYQEPDTNWRIVSSGDYNGDSKDDLLWRHQVDGRIYQMPMSGLMPMPGTIIYNEANPSWRIVADVNSNVNGIPAPSRSLSGAAQFAPLQGMPLNPHRAFDGEPLNPNLMPKQ